jgi:hypothetical protein
VEEGGKILAKRENVIYVKDEKTRMNESIEKNDSADIIAFLHIGQSFSCSEFLSDTTDVIELVCVFCPSRVIMTVTERRRELFA